jgi:hydrogenase maturation protease
VADDPCHCEERSDAAISMVERTHPEIASPRIRGGRNDSGVLVIGIGNPDRGDDAVGRLIARSLRTRVPADVRVVEHDGEATALLAELRHARRVWLVDAAKSGAAPGTIHRVDCSLDCTLPTGSVSSHGFGVAEAVALGRVLDLLPPRCVIYAIEATDFVPGTGLSPPVAAASAEVTRRILEELSHSAGEGTTLGANRKVFCTGFGGN